VHKSGLLKGSGMRNSVILFLVLLLSSASAAGPRLASAQTSFSSTAMDAGQTAASSPIAAGTVITMHNWQQYRQYMSDGVRALFEGKYFWKMPADVRIEVGPTVVHPPPRNYLAATEKYSGQVSVRELADGGLTMQGYRGGIPFPKPAEPHKGWKILTDTYFRYMPHLTVINHAGSCSIDSNRDISCAGGDVVYRQMSFNTDSGVPATMRGFQDEFWTQWYIVTEPEQMRYTASLTIAYADMQRPEELYAFIPSLRRYQPVSSLARCSQTAGMDFTPDDYRAGFDANLTQMKVDYAGEKKVLALLLSGMPGKYPDAYDMPLGWPRPSWGKWQLRDVYVVSASKLRKFAGGYCYGKRVMYIDQATFATYWEELYDPAMRPWKTVGLFLHAVDVPGIGPVDESNSLIYAFWDVSNNHASFLGDPTDKGYPVYVNDQVPNEYRDVRRYSTPAGLNLIMR
jgi:hypothetical protein